MFHEISGTLYELESEARCTSCSSACFEGCNNGCDYVTNPRAMVRIELRFDVFSLVVGG